MLLKVSPASDSKIKINTMSSRWGDRAEMEEALPSPLAASAPPKISCWKNSSSLPRVSLLRQRKVWLPLPRQRYHLINLLLQ
jgi:hypothetical protein